MNSVIEKQNLEEIRRGKIVLGEIGGVFNSGEETTLLKLNQQIALIKSLREFILRTFSLDTMHMLKSLESDSSLRKNPMVYFNFKKLFQEEALCLRIPDENGHARCLITDKGKLITANKTFNLVMKKDYLMLYILGLFRLKRETNILDNEFYDSFFIYQNQFQDKIFQVDGDGVHLPLDNYRGLSDNEKEDLFFYYYHYQRQILQNVKILYDDTLFNRYHTDLNKRKVLALYKGDR